MTSVVLVDDHPIVRRGMRLLLEAQAGFRVVGETEDGLVAVELAEQLQPDLAIVDLMLPDLNGVEVTRRIVRVSPKTCVVALSMYSDESHVIDALGAGAIAYIVKGASSENLLYGIHEALAGRRYLSPPLTDRAVDVYVSQASQEKGTETVIRYSLRGSARCWSCLRVAQATRRSPTSSPSAPVPRRRIARTSCASSTLGRLPTSPSTLCNAASSLPSMDEAIDWKMDVIVSHRYETPTRGMCHRSENDLAL